MEVLAQALETSAVAAEVDSTDRKRALLFDAEEHIHWLADSSSKPAAKLVERPVESAGCRRA